MSRIDVILEGQEELQGSDCSYREGIDIVVKQDTDIDEQLEFNIEGKHYFIKKEDIKTLVNVFISSNT